MRDQHVGLALGYLGATVAAGATLAVAGIALAARLRGPAVDGATR